MPRPTSGAAEGIQIVSVYSAETMNPAIAPTMSAMRFFPADFSIFLALMVILILPILMCSSPSIRLNMLFALFK